MTFVRVIKDPTGLLWLNCDPNKEGPNQGTCTYDVSKAKDICIFSFENKEKFKDPILSRVKKYNEALFYCNEFGPAFSSDLLLEVKEDNDSREYNIGSCIQRSYEKKM